MGKLKSERRSWFSLAAQSSGPRAQVIGGEKISIDEWRTDDGLSVSTLRGDTVGAGGYLGPTVGPAPARLEQRSQYPGFSNSQGLVVTSQIGSAQSAPATTPPAGVMVLPQSRQYAGSTYYSKPGGFTEVEKAGGLGKTRPVVRAPVRAPKRLGAWDWLQEKWGPLPRWAWITGSGVSVTCVAIAAS